MPASMNANEILIELDRGRARIELLQRLVDAFAATLPPPIFYHSGNEHYGFRYGKPDVRHFCLLKAVQAVSALNAMIALARGGFAYEICVLVRTVIECTTHIEFVLDALDENDGLAPDVGKYIGDFFADFARNSAADFKRAQFQQGVIHQRLGATLDNISLQVENDGQRATSAQLYSHVYRTYSSYVHGKYPEIMDLYGGVPGRFHLDGMRGTPKDDENLHIIDTFAESASLALKLMVSRLRLHQLIAVDPELVSWFQSS